MNISLRYLLTRQTATISNRVFLLDDSVYKLGNLKRFRFEYRQNKSPEGHIISEIWKFQTEHTSEDLDTQKMTTKTFAHAEHICLKY